MKRAFVRDCRGMFEILGGHMIELGEAKFATNSGIESTASRLISPMFASEDCHKYDRQSGI
jgi:hypothetical protein